MNEELLAKINELTRIIKHLENENINIQREARMSIDDLKSKLSISEAESLNKDRAL